MSSPDCLAELESLRSQVAELLRTLAERDRSMQDLREQSDLLRTIVEETATNTGEDFFRSLVRHLAQALNVRYAFVGTWRPETPDLVRALAVWSGTDFAEPFEYALQHTPCATVVGQRLCLYESGVQRLFPEDHLLAQMNVDSYCGMPLFDRFGQPLGLLVVMDNRPMTRVPLVKDLLQVFAARATAELQHQQAEEEVQCQRRHLIAAQALAHLGSWDWDIESGKEVWSDEQFRIFGYEPGSISVVYETFMAALLPDDHDRVLVAINDALMGRFPYEVECRLVRPNGEVCEIQCRGDVHRDETGCPIRMVGTVLDITERKQVERALLASEERWHLAVQGSNDGIWDWNIRTGEVFFSLRWKAMRGFEDHEISNHLDEGRSRIHPDDLDRVLQRIDAYLAKQTPEFCEEYRVQRKDGSYMWIFDRGVAHWADDGTALRMAGSETDITERKRLEQALCASEERFALAAAGSTDALWDAHPIPGEPWYAPQTPVWWSPRIRAWLGLDESEPFETLEQWAVRLHPEDKDRIFGQLAAHIEQRVPYDAEYRLRTNCGDYRWIRGRGQAMWDEQGPHRMSGSCQDITERKQAEEALSVSEARFRTTFEQAAVGMYLCDLDGRICQINQAMCRMLGYTEQELLARDFQSITHPEDLQTNLPRIEQLVKGELPSLFIEKRHLHRDGSVIWAHASVSVIHGHAGQPTQLLAMVQDITERKQVEDRLRRTQFAVDQATDYIFVIGHDGYFLDVNESACARLGYTKEELLTKCVTDIDPDFPPGVWESFWDEFTQKKLLRLETRHRSKSGEIYPVEVVANYILHDGKELDYAFVRDISERKAAEEALRASEERFDLAVRGSNTGIWDWDLRTNKSYFSPLWKRMLGYEEQDLLGEFSEWEERLHPDDRERALATVRAYLEGMTPQYELEHRLRHKDGRYRWILARGVSIADAEGRPYRMAGSHIDITEQKHIQESLTERERQLRTVLDALPVGVWFTDPSGKPLLVNPAAKQIWSGIRQVGVESTPTTAGWWEAFGPSSELHRWALGRVLTTGSPSLNETLDLECFDGTRKTIRNTAVPVQDEAGAVLGAIVLNEDITALRHMQEALKLTQFSVDHAVEAFFWIGPDASILHVNESACQMLEYTRDELTSMTVHDIDPNFPQEIWRAHWEELKQKGSLTFESKHWSRTGRVLDTEVTINYLQYEGKEYNCAIMRDIGERTRAEAALRASEERYRALYDETPTVYFTLTTDGTVRFVNRYGADQLGYDVEELIGHSVLGVFHEDDREAVSTSLSECLTTPEATRHWEFRKVRKDGQVLWVREAARVGQSPFGETVVLVTCEDITAQKLAEAQQAKQYDQLQAIFRMTMTLSRASSLDDIYGEAIDCMQQALKADRASILLFDESGVMRFKASRGLSERYQSAVEGHSPWTREAVAPQPILVDDIASAPSVDQYREIFRAEGFSALGFIPLVLPEGLLGKFMIYYDQPHRFTVEEIGVANTIAGQVAYTIQRTRTDQALRVSEERYRSLVDNAPIGIFLNEAGRFTYVNREMQRILRATHADQLLGMPILDRIAPEFHQIVQARIRQLMEKAQPVPTIDEQYVGLDGSRVDVAVTAIPTIFNGAIVTQVLVLDITERKKAEEALREKHALLSTIMDATADIIFVKDLQGRYLHMNLAGARAVGMPVEEVVGKDDDAIWPADLAACCKEADRKILASGAAQTMEESTTVDGCRITYLTTKAPYRDATGRMIGIIGVAHDISQIKRSEEELRRSHAFLRQVIDIDPNFVFAKDRAGRFTLVNKAVAEAYGTTVEHLIGKTDADFNADLKEVAFFHEKDVQVMDSLQDLFIPEEVITDSTGKMRWLQTVKRPILDEEGRAIMVLGAATDITERKRMEETLRQRERDLRAAIEERERISQDLHDGILQSLFAVGLTLETTKSMMPPKERKTSGLALDQAIDRLNRLMHEVRNFIAGLGSDLLQGRDLPTALHHMLETLTKHHPTHVRLKIEDRAAQALSAEQSVHLLLVIQEAVSNCIRHGHAQEATVSLKLLKQGVRLSVRDNGCGFDSAASKGIGHGLANMAARAQKIGGRLTVLSKTNEGTRVVLDLPKEAALACR